MKIRGVTDSVIRLLREKLITGVFPAGHKLNEVELSEQIGISRPPLREAFRRLEHEKLLVCVPRKGTYVADMSIEDCEQVYYSRRVLECAAIKSIQGKGITILPLAEKALANSETYTVPDNPTPQQMYEYYQVMAALHVALIESCGNNWLRHCYRGISASLARYQVIYLTTMGSGKASVQEHAEIQSLIRKGQYDAACWNMQQHIDKTVQRIKKRMHMHKTPAA